MLSTRTIYTFFSVFIYFYFVYITTTHAQTENAALGRLISVSNAQSCLNVDKSATSTQGTSQMSCNKATIIVLDVIPGQDSTADSSPFRFDFVSIPDTSSVISQSSVASGDNTGTIDCSNFQDKNLCQNAASIDGSAFISVDISLSPIVGRYDLSSTGLTIPFTYFYHTCPAASKSPKATWDSCSQCTDFDPDDVAYDTRDVIKYNTEYEDISGPNKFWTPVSLTEEFLRCRRDSEATSGTDQTSFASTHGCVGGDANDQDEDSKNVVFSRFRNGTCGCGGSLAGVDTFECSPTISSYCFNPLTTPPAGSSPNPSRSGITYPVCPGGPLPRYELRNDKFYKTCCRSGSCAGFDDGLCPLHAGLVFGNSRCAMSGVNAKDAFEAYSDAGDVPDVKVNGNFYPDITKRTKDFADTCFHAWPSGQLTNPEYEPFTIDIDSMTDTAKCGCFMAGVLSQEECPFKTDNPSSNPIDGPRFPLNKYPTFYDQRECSLGVDYDRDEFRESASRWGSCTAGGSGDNNDFVYSVDGVVFDINLQEKIKGGGAGKDFRLLLNTYGDKLVRSDGASVPELPPRDCACSIDWYDAVVPVGPTCTVYRINAEAEPVYKAVANVTVRFQNGTTVNERLTVGTLSANKNNTDLSIALKQTDVDATGKIQMTWLGDDEPRGSVSDNLKGYIVVCGDKPTCKNNTYDGTLSFRMAHSTKDPLGIRNPWRRFRDALDDKSKSQNRYPLPSTIAAMKAAGAIDNPIYNALGSEYAYDCESFSKKEWNEQDYSGNSYAWWYYVPEKYTSHYGKGCGQNGFVSYGNYDDAAANAMCAGRGGTCVPGYDLNNFPDGITTKTELIENPTVKQPCWVAREFNKFEWNADGNVPEFVPPGTNPLINNYWLNNNGLLTDTGVNGQPLYPSDKFSVRIKIAVAGSLIGEAISISSGSLAYTTSSRDPGEQPLSDCLASVETFSGQAKLIVSNDGDLPGEFSVGVTCQEGAIFESDVQNRNSFDLAAKASSIFAVPLSLNGTVPIEKGYFNCVASLFFGPTQNVKLDNLNLLCSITKTTVAGVGDRTVGSASGGNPNASPASDPNLRDGDEPDACAGWFGSFVCSAGNLLSFGALKMRTWLGILLLYIITFILFICAFYVYGNVQDNLIRKDMKAKVKEAAQRKKATNLALIQEAKQESRPR